MNQEWREAALALMEKPEEVRRHYVRYEGLVEVDGGWTEEYTVLGHKLRVGLWEDSNHYYMDPVSKRFWTGKEIDMVFELEDTISMEAIA